MVAATEPEPRIHLELHGQLFRSSAQCLGLSFANQSWFLPGGDNYVRFWINNTGTGISGSPVIGSYNNPTALQTYGYITYDTTTAVPEPASLLLGTGLAGIAGRFWRKPRR